jgi:tRNA (cytidine/uridine-2'-O-)-methyltransferase
MVEDARSLNLSNCVAIVTYEILRQQNYLSLSRKEVLKGEDFLLRVNNDD